ncbi:hypothetical protein CYY_003166 [Polysphondylium violaceum]|uniref:Uncharacterized protein n=1 Tax=Polysphondylium violaceum TaxID=133409 RepID=A0A8J4V0E0_9MYCE|nr:hypothetical protein CYY_003166 [Polysphondylium violaceum]
MSLDGESEQRQLVVLVGGLINNRTNSRFLSIIAKKYTEANKSNATFFFLSEKIDLTTRDIPNRIYLKDTAIQDLNLRYMSLGRYDLYPGFFPFYRSKHRNSWI